MSLLVHQGLTATALSRHGLPPRTSAGLALRSLGEAAAGTGRAATMLTPVPLAAALLLPSGRRALSGMRRRGPLRTSVLITLLAAPLPDIVRLRPVLDPSRFTALAVVDDVAYGTGVWVGALRAPTVRPLQPRIIRSRRPRREE